MNHFDNNKMQYQMYGNQTYEPKSCARRLDFDTKMCEKNVLRQQIAEMSKTGRFDEAMDMICETIEKMELRIRELEEK